MNDAICLTIERGLLEKFDEKVKELGYINRMEAIREMVRNTVNNGDNGLGKLSTASHEEVEQHDG